MMVSLDPTNDTQAIFMTQQLTESLLRKICANILI